MGWLGKGGSLGRVTCVRSDRSSLQQGAEMISWRWLAASGQSNILVTAGLLEREVVPKYR